jgi:hypothetical protein
VHRLNHLLATAFAGLQLLFPGWSITGAAATPVVTLFSDDSVTAEPAGRAHFSVARDGGTLEPLAVTYTVSGTATAGLDCRTLSGTVTIAAGKGLSIVPVDVLDDDRFEGCETLVVTLAASSSYLRGAATTATITLMDNEVPPTVTLFTNDPFTAEPAGTAHFTVSRSVPLVIPTVVHYLIAGTAAGGLDYVALPGTVTIPGGQTSVVVTVQMLDDAQWEGSETVALQLTANPDYRRGAQQTATLTLLDNEVPPTVTLFTNDPFTAEPAGTAHFTVSRSVPSAVPTVVHYQIAGTAAGGLDYVALPGSVTIPGGQTSVVVTVQVLDDARWEGGEAVALQLSASPDYRRGAQQAITLILVDNEVPPTLSVIATVPLAIEGGGQPGIFTVTRTGSTDSDLVFDQAFTGSAIGGVDYELVPTQLTIPKGSATVALAVQPLGDNPFRHSRTAVVTLQPNGRYRIASPGDTATVTLRNSDYYAVAEPSVYQVFQRDAAGEATIRIQGFYHGPPQPIEAAWGAGDWQVIDPAPSDHFAGGLTKQPAGQAPLRVRIQGQPDSEFVVAYVGVGDVFAVWGQSNGSGRGVNNQSYSHPTLKAALFGNDWQWSDLKDPTDRNTGQVDLVSSDVDHGMGSVWPLVATRLMAELNIPVAFVPCTKGAAGFPAWSPVAADPLDRATLFGSAVSRCLAVGGVKAVLWWNGEGGFDDVTGNVYVTPFKQMSAQLAVHLPGVNIVPCKLQYCVGISDTRQHNGWHAIQRIWDEDPNATSGPTLADDPPPPEGNLLTEDEGRPPPWYHLKSDAALAAAADRWTAVLLDLARPPALQIVLAEADAALDGKPVSLSVASQDPVLPPSSNVTAADQMLLVWPKSGTYVLEESTSPDSVWTAVEAAPAVVGEEMFFSVPFSKTKAFFRLHRR